MSTPTPAEQLATDMLQRCAKLSARERDVLILSSKGLTTAEAGKALGLSTHTVADHRKHLFRKLDVTNIVEAAVIAAKAGLV